jgi:hypothetical protein
MSGPWIKKKDAPVSSETARAIKVLPKINIFLFLKKRSVLSYLCLVVYIKEYRELV